MESCRLHTVWPSLRKLGALEKSRSHKRVKRLRHVGSAEEQKHQEYKLYWILEQKARADKFLSATRDPLDIAYLIYQIPREWH